MEKRDVAKTGAPEEEPSADTLEEAREKTHVKFAFWIMAMIQVSKSCLVQYSVNHCHC